MHGGAKWEKRAEHSENSASTPQETGQIILFNPRICPREAKNTHSAKAIITALTEHAILSHAFKACPPPSSNTGYKAAAKAQKTSAAKRGFFSKMQTTGVASEHSECTATTASTAKVIKPKNLPPDTAATTCG